MNNTAARTPLSDLNSDLTAPIIEILRASKKDAPTKVGARQQEAAAALEQLKGQAQKGRSRRGARPLAN